MQIMPPFLCATRPFPHWNGVGKMQQLWVAVKTNGKARPPKPWQPKEGCPKPAKQFTASILVEAIERKRVLENFTEWSRTGDRPKYRRFYCRLCSACGLGQWWFVICLGFLGAVVAITDIMDILGSTQRGPLLTESIWRNRLHRGNQRLVSPEAERDMKLMVTILSVEHYLLMIFGVLQTNPALLMPWLMMEAVIIALEAVFFGMRLFVEGLAITRAEVIMSAIVIHNWFQVFCFFRKYISVCDL